MTFYWDKGRQTFNNMFSSPPPVRYHGLLNQGATCYLNSVLQVLFMTEDFRQAVERHCCENPDSEWIDHQLKDLFDDLKEQTAYTYKITRRLGISRVYEQQDAAEYYEKILNLTSRKASQIFHGWVTDRTTCSGCGTETDTDGAFWHLPLALVDSHSEHYSVVDGIKEHFRASEFSGQNQMYCEECDDKCDATIQCVMKHHPNVLMLLLKRFDFDYRYMTYVKINQTVDVPRTLQIPENQTYELYAVVDHFGDLRSGHYSANIRDDEKWFKFNDNSVTLADYQPFQVDNFDRSRSAYLLFYRKTSDTQPTGLVSAPGDQLPSIIDVPDQSEDVRKKRQREKGEAINRDEETKRVRSQGLELQPEPRYYENDQVTIPDIHQVRNEERNDKNHLQDTEKHRDEGEILLGDNEGMGGNAEAENQTEEMKLLLRVTQPEESVDDQDSERENAQDVSDNLKPDISGMFAKDAHLRKEGERSEEETGEMDVKTGEDKQLEEKDNAGENVDGSLRCAQEVVQDKILKPVSEDEQREERGGRTEAGERGITSETGRLDHDYRRDSGRKQNMPRDDHQHREERMDVQEVGEQKRGDDKHAQRDTSVTECYSEGLQAQDSDSVAGRLDDVSLHPEQKIYNNVELDKKGKTGVSERGMGSGPTKLTKADHLHSTEIQDDRRVDYNKQKVPKDNQRCEEAGRSRYEGHEQERGVRRGVKGVMEKRRGDSEHPRIGQDVEDHSSVGLDDGQPKSEQKISGTYVSSKDGSVEKQSKHIQNRSDSHRRAGSAGSSKPTECEGAGCGEQVRRSNSQLKSRKESNNTEIKTPNKEIRSETVAGTSVQANLSNKFAELEVSESSQKRPKKRANQEAVGKAQEESRASKKQKLSDTEDQAGKKKKSFLSFLRRKGKKKRKKKETTRPIWCFVCGSGKNVDSD